MLTVEREVARLLGDMRKAAMGNARAEVETTEIASIAMAQKLPIIDGDTPDSLINLHAQAVIVRSWRKHGEAMQALKALNV